MKTGDVYIGISSDEEILEKTEDGGVVTSLLKFALKSKLVDTVVAVRKGKNRYEGELSFMTEPEEINE